MSAGKAGGWDFSKDGGVSKKGGDHFERGGSDPSAHYAITSIYDQLWLRVKCFTHVLNPTEN